MTQIFLMEGAIQTVPPSKVIEGGEVPAKAALTGEAAEGGEVPVKAALTGETTNPISSDETVYTLSVTLNAEKGCDEKTMHLVPRDPKLTFSIITAREGGTWKGDEYLIGSGGKIKLRFRKDVEGDQKATPILANPLCLLYDNIYWRNDERMVRVDHWPVIEVSASQVYRDKLWPDGRNHEYRERHKRTVEINIAFDDWKAFDGPRYEVPLDSLFQDKDGKRKVSWSRDTGGCLHTAADTSDFSFEKHITISLSIDYGPRGPYVLHKTIRRVLFTLVPVMPEAKAALTGAK